MRTDKVYLVGFMGAGKTSVARALGPRLGWQVADVDELIEAREKRTVPAIFADSGEPYFRAVERDVVRQILGERPAVVATGGGTFVDPEVRRLLKEDGATVWLDVPFELAVDRAPRDGRRPLAVDRAQFEALFRQRQVAYRQAHFRLDASRAPVEELVERILDWLGF